jgi:hypothetical protein
MTASDDSYNPNDPHGVAEWEPRFARHVLAPIGLTPRLKGWKLAEPGTWNMGVVLVFLDGLIFLSGDACLGQGDANGVSSRGGYGLSWFLGNLDPGYLGGKFYRREWNRKSAARSLEGLAADVPADDVAKDELAKRYVRGLEDLVQELRSGEIATEGELYDAVNRFNDAQPDRLFQIDVCELGGYDLPAPQTGMLAAVQRRFGTEYERLYGSRSPDACLQVGEAVPDAARPA